MQTTSDATHIAPVRKAPYVQAALPPDYWATEQDAVIYTRRCLICAGVVFVAYGLNVAGALPLAGLVLLGALVLPRWMINLHELLHLYDDQQIHPFIRLMGVSPLPISPISLSYEQTRLLHAGHHAAPATETDPDAYHIRGSWIGTLFNAFIAPEQSSLRWLMRHGLSRQLAVDMLIKLCLLVGLVWLGDRTFLWFWLSLRLVYGLSDFAFFRLVHHRKGDYGTFALSLPSVVVALGEFVFGKTVIQTTIHHDIHHQNPRIAARALASARTHMEATAT